MILPKLIETIIRTPSGGVMTDENKLDRDFVASNIHQVRAESIINWLQNPKNGPHDLWYQIYYPDFETNLQASGNCVVKFKIPVPINLPGYKDGIEYFGTDDGFTPFVWTGAGAMKAVYAAHRVTNRRGFITYSWEYNEGGYAEMEVKGNKLFRRGKMKLIAANPLDVPTFRQDKDEYPITEELLPFMIRRLFDLQTRIIVEKKADAVDDGQDRSNL